MQRTRTIYKRKIKPALVMGVAVSTVASSGVCAFADVSAPPALMAESAIDINNMDWSNKAVSSCADVVNIRSGSSTACSRMGVFLPGAIAEIMGEENGWTKIHSGNVEGYILSELLVSGEDAKTQYEKVKKMDLAAINAEALEVYADSSSGEVVGMAQGGEVYEVHGRENGWCEIAFYDGVGYVREESVTSAFCDNALTLREYGARFIGADISPMTGVDSPMAQIAAANVSLDVMTGQESIAEMPAEDTGEILDDVPEVVSDVPADDTVTEPVAEPVTDWSGETAGEITDYTDTGYEGEYTADPVASGEWDEQADLNASDWSAEELYVDDGAAEYQEDAGYEYIEEPAYDEPVYEEPIYEEPVYEEPVYEEPSYEEPAADYGYDDGGYAGESYDTPSVSSSDLDLLAAIIQCEAGGESREGKVAVGACVLNRVNSDAFPDTISDVIYEDWQFTPAMTGLLDSTLASGVRDDCYEAAQAALNGENPIGDLLFFHAGDGDGLTIGNQTFY